MSLFREKTKSQGINFCWSKEKFLLTKTILVLQQNAWIRRFFNQKLLTETKETLSKHEHIFFQTTGIDKIIE